MEGPECLSSTFARARETNKEDAKATIRPRVVGFAVLISQTRMLRVREKISQLVSEAQAQIL